MTPEGRKGQKSIQTTLSDYFKSKTPTTTPPSSSPCSSVTPIQTEPSTMKRTAVPSKENGVERLMKKRALFRTSIAKNDDGSSETLSNHSNVSSIQVSSSVKSLYEVGSNDNSSFTSDGKKEKLTTFTPLEKQVLKLKKEYPGIILAIEVGYKYRFFGDDAKVAAQHLNVVCWQDRHFLTASVPSYRIQVHIRRLVLDGYKVGLVQQMETAAIKAAGNNKYAPFERKLTQMYTSATLIDVRNSRRRESPKFYCCLF